MTPKQQAFVREYAIDRNATQAATRAGYSAKTAEQLGYQLLQKPSVIEAIGAQEARHREQCDITVEAITIMLQEDRLKAHEYGHAGAAVSASMGLAKLHGLLVDKVDAKLNNKYDGMSDEDLLKRFKQLAAIGQGNV